MEQIVTNTPAVLAGAVSGQRYSVQNHGGVDVYLTVSQNAPDPAHLGWAIPGRGTSRIHAAYPLATSPERIWAWTKTGDCTVYFTEAN